MVISSFLCLTGGHYITGVMYLKEFLKVLLVDIIAMATPIDTIVQATGFTREEIEGLS